MTTSPITTRLARTSELEQVTELCVAAFADEAVLAWLLPDPRTRPDHIRARFGASLGAAIEASALVLAVADPGEVVAVSVWVPRTGREEAAAPTGEDRRAAEPSGEDRRVAGRLAVLQRATERHRPDTPHLHLSSMAVRPEHRRRGAGGAMIAAGLGRARRLGLAVHLEASTPANRRLYLRHGFRDHGEPVRLPDGGPSLHPMWLTHR